MLWSLLWLIGVVWMITILGIPSGLIRWWMFGVITFGAFIAAWWLNLRLVNMLRQREAGRCWKCGYDLNGIDAVQCPECGIET